MPKFVTVWDTRTGRKLPHPVPESHLRVFPHLSITPSSRRRRRSTKPAEPVGDITTATPAPRADVTAPEEESHAPQSD